MILVVMVVGTVKWVPIVLAYVCSVPSKEPPVAVSHSLSDSCRQAQPSLCPPIQVPTQPQTLAVTLPSFPVRSLPLASLTKIGAVVASLASLVTLTPLVTDPPDASGRVPAPPLLPPSPPSLSSSLSPGLPSRWTLRLWRRTARSSALSSSLRRWHLPTRPYHCPPSPSASQSVPSTMTEQTKGKRTPQRCWCSTAPTRNSTRPRQRWTQCGPCQTDGLSR
mmetsp:Transcript_4308/g.13991  ORF Transcript_4308/g.13991 Transcript_4308/m.13991 type:complete len:221 (-) Transcript_4308:59-721(-)